MATESRSNQKRSGEPTRPRREKESPVWDGPWRLWPHKGAESLREPPADLDREIGYQPNLILRARWRALSRQAAKTGPARSKQAGVFWRNGARDGKEMVCAVWVEIGKSCLERALRALSRKTQRALIQVDRDRGEPCGSTPPTPPGIRVRTTAVRLG